MVSTTFTKETHMDLELPTSSSEATAVIGTPIEIVVSDKPGLLSTVAGVLSLLRLDVRSARTKSHGISAVMEWIVIPDPHAPALTEKALHRELVDALASKASLTQRISDRIAAYAQLPTIPVPAPVVETFLDAATDATIGDYFNVGGVGETTIKELALKVIKQTQSTSTIKFIPYSDAYPAGFEDMQRRVPDISKIKKAIDWEPKHSLDSIIDGVATSLKG